MRVEFARDGILRQLFFFLVAVEKLNSSINSCYLADVSLPTYYREELLHLDHALSDRLHLGLHYIHDE